MNHITLIGSFGASNIGDEAILESTLQMLRNYYPESTIHILSAHPSETLHKYEHYQNITSSSPLPFGMRSLLKIHTIGDTIKILKKTDTVLFPGGGLFTDSETLYALLLWYMHFLFCRHILKKKIVMSGQSIGPISSRIGRILVSSLLKHAHTTIVRDKESLEYIHKYFPTNHKRIYSHLDPVCFIDTHVEKKHLSQRLRDIHKHISVTHTHIAVSIRPWHNQEFKLMELLIRTLKKENATHALHVHLIPMQYKGTEDVSILQHFAHILTKEGIKYTLYTPENYREVLHILSFCSKAIGMRLHFLILAALAKVPFLALSYSSKVAGFVEHLRTKSFIHCASSPLMIENAVEDFLKKYKEQETYLEIFQEHCRTQKNREESFLAQAVK